MKCPFCTTENREDREECYHCGKDISMLRLIVNKARHHYNLALEHAERQRFPEALAELQHSLDLDHSFAPALVVMGTVYAKMERFDEAQAAWNAALALDSHILKAHEYIGKADVARAAAPLSKRLRWGAGMLLAAAALFLLAALWLALPSSDPKQIEQIVAGISRGDYSHALHQAQHLQEAGERPETRLAAAVFVNAINQRYETAFMTMMTMLLDRRPLEAHRFFQAVIKPDRPPERYLRQLAALDEQAGAQAVELADAWRREYEAQRLEYPELAARLETVRLTFANRPEVVTLADVILTSANRTLIERTVAAVPESTGLTSETLAWLAQLRQLPKEPAEAQDAVASATSRLVAGEMARFEQALTSATRTDNVEVIETLVAGLKPLAAYATSDTLQAFVEKANAAVREARTDRLLAQLAKANMDDAPKIEQAIAAHEGASTVTAERLGEVVKAIDGARRRLASDIFDSFTTARDRRFADGRMTAEEARRVADHAPFAIRYLARKTTRPTRDRLTFYTGIARLRLGDLDEAARWFDRLEQEFPKSPYRKQLGRFRKEIAAKRDENPPPAPRE
jgi:tetratricopeptide (TPR) repeat protein